MRVLLRDGQHEVVVSEAASGRRIARITWASGEGLRVNGGPIVASWRSSASGGPFDVQGARVRGVVEVLAVLAPTDGARPGLAVVNEVPLESYLNGILAREMYGSWSASALEAQAVASRTYALHELMSRRERPWYVSAGASSQVYAGVEAESDAVRAAVEATRGEILTEDGDPILAVFHSSSGGRTASAREVWGEARDYLVSVPVEDEWDSPDSYWRVRVSRTTLGRAAEALGHEIGPVVAARVGQRTESGRVASVELTGERGTAVLSGRELRSVLGESNLKSTLFELREDGEDFVVVGSGNGHGVGMSQWGARAMARRGDDYRAILRTFYPGAKLTRGSWSGGARALGGGR